MTDSYKEMERLLEKVHRERGFDFREYRETTLVRRLSRRLHARGVATYADYARILDQDPTEYDKLFDALTINVTSFFRDEVAFQALAKVGLPALMANASKSIKVWCAGCATGQEPYSIAMLLLEMLGPEIDLWQVTILGTDIDTKALDYARDGLFTLEEVKSVQPAWISTHFGAEGSRFRVSTALRKLVTFDPHGLGSDPPYRDLDLVVCRNTLIYFSPVLQTRVLKGFHEGLKESGFLLLGRAEMPPGETRHLFQWVDRQAKLFRKASQRRLRRASSTPITFHVPPTTDEGANSAERERGVGRWL